MPLKIHLRRTGQLRVLYTIYVRHLPWLMMTAKPIQPEHRRNIACSIQYICLSYQTTKRNMATSAATFLDLDVSPIQGQTAWALLDLQGNLLKKSGEFPPQDVSILFQMLMESTNLVKEGFRRLTVSLATSTYLVSLDDAHIYLVQTRV